MSINKFVVSGAGRCGSTMMMSSLRQHPEIKVFDEIFNRDLNGVDKSIFDEWIPYGLWDTVTHQKMCTKKACVKAHEKYDGFKLLFGHIHNDVEEYLSDIKMVLLLRNPFKIAISSLVADMTKVYCGPCSFKGTLSVDPQEIEGRISYTIEESKYFSRYADLIINYEDDFQENYNKVCDLAEVSHFTPEVITKIRITRPLSEVIENYEEVQHLDREYDFYR